jgi:hypothetical protein
MSENQRHDDPMAVFGPQAMEQARRAVDTYFEFLKKTVSSYPSGGNELGEKFKIQAEQNITAVHELVKSLSHAKDFQEALRIQTEFMQTQLKAFGEQATSLGEAYAKAAGSIGNVSPKKP